MTLFEWFVFQTCTVAVIVPDVEVFPQWAKGKGHEGDIEELCKNKVSDLW